MKVAIHQPDYIPWLGLFYKMYLSDIFIHLDDAQYSNEAAHNFNVIKTPQGRLRLKIPVEQHLGYKINEVRTKDELKWKEKHLRTLEMNYTKSKYFKEIFPELKDAIMIPQKNIAEFNIFLNEYFASKFGINPKFKKASQLPDTNSVREQRVIDLTCLVGGTEYISGNGARVYQDEEHFISRGLKLSYLDYKPISYPQLWNNFEQSLSVLDFIFNCNYDFDYVLKMIKKINNI